MRNSRVLYIFLLALNFWGTSGTARLDEFLKAVDDAHSELHWLNERSADRIHLRKRSASIGELLSRFDIGDDEAELGGHELEGGDAWYQSFRAMECRHGGCQKKPLRWMTRKTQPDDYYEYYEEAMDEKKQKDLKDQWEQTANDLSHEANYKLSKIEQDAVEKSLPDTAWPVHRNIKRRVDPMDTIKLKTSLRMLANGNGPSLPSSILSDDRDKITVEDILSSPNGAERGDPWKESFEMRESRKLLSVEEPAEDPVREVKTTLVQALDMQQFDNLKQKTALDRQLGGLTFDNTQMGNEQYEKKNALTALSDDLMRTAAFVKLQNYLKSNQENKSTSAPQSSAGKASTVPLNLVEKDHDVNIKLHMSVNATVLGDNNLPNEFHRNNTITFPPPTGNGKDKVKINEEAAGQEANGEVRQRRRVAFPIIVPAPKRGTNDEISKSVIEATQNFPLDEIITGKLTSQLVKTIFALVKTSPTLKVLWPGLMRNRVTSPSDVKNFDSIRTHENESEMHRTETLLHQAMETINAIIEQQVRSRSCVPLRSDLMAFYNLIIQSQMENERRQERRKRESESDLPAHMSDNQIRKKSKIVKKLLRDYEELPRDDQEQVASIKSNLLVAAEQLREMQQQSRRRKRQIMELHLNNNQTSSAFETRNINPNISPEYMKLTKTAELLLHNSFKDPDLPLGFSYI